MSLKLMYITNDIDIALIAQKYGVSRIWIDLEKIGKNERQRGLDAVKSTHKISDIAKIKPLLTTSEMLVRINKWNNGSKDEIDAVINAGADIIMLPYWKTADEVKCFTDAVGGRCKTTLLLETRQAVDCIDEVLNRGGFDEIHIGLNDLHLSYGLDFMFELLTDGTVETLCEKFAARGLPYGFGGIAKIGDGAVPAEKIILEHYRLGSTRAILSRTFCDNAKIPSVGEINRVFDVNMRNLRAFEAFASNAGDGIYRQNRMSLIADVEKVAKEMKSKKMRGQVKCL